MFLIALGLHHLLPKLGRHPGRILPLPDLAQDVEVVDVQRHNSGIFRIFFVGLVGWPVNDGGPASGLNVLQTALDRRPDALLGEQRIFPSGVHEPILSPQPEAQAVPVADLPPHVFHEHKEVAQVVGVLNGGPQIRLQHGAESGLSPGLAEPLNVADRLIGAALHDDRQPMLPAQPVRGGPDLPVVALGVAVILLSGVGVDGIEHHMGVNMLLVHMDTDHRLIPRQMLLGKFCGDLQGLLRRDLPRLEGLDDVVILHPVLLAHRPFGVQHLAALPARVTVEVGGEDSFLGLVPIEDVIDARVQAALPGQYFRDSHAPPCRTTALTESRRGRTHRSQ